MNLPNRLSLARILAVPLFLILLFGGTFFYEGMNNWVNALFHFLALQLAIAVTITDWLDGKIAREQGIITNLGKLLDPLADKIFVTAALIALVELDKVPFWAVVIIISREFLVTGLRSLAHGAGRVIAADRIGKHKTGWQMGLIITALTVQLAEDFLRAADGFPLLPTPAGNVNMQAVFEFMILIPLAVTLVLTIWSGLHYLRVNRDLLKEM